MTALTLRICKVLVMVKYDHTWDIFYLHVFTLLAFLINIYPICILMLMPLNVFVCT